MRRIERLVNLIAALLDTPRPLTAEEIRGRVAGYGEGSKEAFRRAFERDKADLRAAGIPVELRTIDALTESEGYVIPKERYYLSPPDLAPDELAALRIAASSLIGDEGMAATGVMKLSLDAESEPMPRPPFVWGAQVAAESASMGALYAAVASHVSVSFDYRADEATTVRRLEPYSLAYRRGNWYVVGRDLDRDAIRSFRVSRVEGQVHTGDPFQPPASFEVDDHLDADPFSLGAPGGSAELRFDPSVAWWARQNLTAYEQREVGGGIEVRVPMGNLGALVSFVIGFGGAVEIASPPEAREAVRDHLSRFLRPA